MKPTAETLTISGKTFRVGQTVRIRAPGSTGQIKRFYPAGGVQPARVWVAADGDPKGGRFVDPGQLEAIT